MPDGHEHAWNVRVHGDGCHAFTWIFGCECGAMRTVTGERDPADPFFSEWADEACERCKELLAGADRKPATDETVVPS